MSGLLIINASPRKEGTSAMFCKCFEDSMGGRVCHLYKDVNSVDWLLPEIDKAETIIIAGPCYIDTYPAQVVFLLERIAEHPELCHGQKVYGIIQGGMPYVHTHESGLRMLKLFCRDCNMQYRGGFVMGLGPVLDGKPLKFHPNAKKIVPAFNEFMDYVRRGEESPDQLYRNAEMKIPAIVTKFLTFSMNRSIDKKLKQCGFDYKNPSPYLERE